MNKQNYYIDNFFTPKTLIYPIVFLGAMSIAYVIINYGIIMGILLSFIPVALILIFSSLNNPRFTFFLSFIINYFLMGFGRYVTTVPWGVVLDLMLATVVFSLLIKSITTKVEWRNAINLLSILATIWFVYCLFEFFNPNAIPLAWGKSNRGIASYFFALSIITPIVLTKFIDFKRFMMILSVLTIVAVLKVFVQKYWGFDIFEKRWLYASGGSSTHIIHSGVRYFSFFTDAGNFGAAMGFASVLFALLSQHISKNLRYYYIFVSVFAAIGLILSGTRGALFIPFAGFAIGIILTKNFKKITIGTFVLFAFVLFLMFSTRGNGNSYIRRMRTAFDTEDASFMVRKNNQAQLWDLMKEKPFGTGIGMGGVKAKEFAPNDPIPKIATDSWYVLIWVETGIVGILLYLTIQITLLIYNLRTILRLKDPSVRGCMIAVFAALFGMMVAAYGNEIWGQLPNIFIFTVCQVFLIISPKLDREVTEKIA